MAIFDAGVDAREIALWTATRDATRLLRNCYRPASFVPQTFLQVRLYAMGSVESPIEERFVAAFPMAGSTGIFVRLCDELDHLRGLDTLPPNENYLIPQFQVDAWRLDFALVRTGPDGNLLAKIAIECDGHNFHERTKDQAARDRKRDRELQQLGWVVLRFTGSEIHRDVCSCCDDAMMHFIRVLEEKGSADLVASLQDQSAEEVPCA